VVTLAGLLLVLLLGGAAGWLVRDVTAGRGSRDAGAPASPTRGSDARSGSPREPAPSDPGAAPDWDGRIASEAGRLVAAQRLVDARERALEERDRSAWLATLDPRDARARRQAAAIFDHLADVPVADWDLALAGGVTSDGAALVVPVTVGHRLRTYDTGWVRRDTSLRLVRRGGRWRVARASAVVPDGEDAQARPVRDLWHLGDVHVARTPRVLALGTADAATVRRLGREVAAAVPRVTGRWGRAWARRVVVLVPRTVGEMATLLGTRSREVTRIAAVTTAQAPGGAEGRADRVVVNPRAFSGLSDLGRSVVLTHEVTHVATRGVTTGEVPTWLSEGLADYVAYDGTGLTRSEAAAGLLADVRRGEVPHRLPTGDDFAGTADGLSQAYEMAWMACLHVAERYGEDALFRLYRTTASDGLTTALDTELGTSLSRLTSDWRAFLRREAART
jgi:hypothetical protein